MVNATAQLEGLGETLIPAINRLQDIFSQVGVGVGVVRRLHQAPCWTSTFSFVIVYSKAV